jgi:hypothetical protein
LDQGFGFLKDSPGGIIAFLIQGNMATLFTTFLTSTLLFRRQFEAESRREG